LGPIAEVGAAIGWMEEAYHDIKAPSKPYRSKGQNRVGKAIPFLTGAAGTLLGVEDGNPALGGLLGYATGKAIVKNIDKKFKKQYDAEQAKQKATAPAPSPPPIKKPDPIITKPTPPPADPTPPPPKDPTPPPPGNSHDVTININLPSIPSTQDHTFPTPNFSGAGSILQRQGQAPQHAPPLHPKRHHKPRKHYTEKRHHKK